MPSLEKRPPIAFVAAGAVVALMFHILFNERARCVIVWSSLRLDLGSCSTHTMLTDWMRLLETSHLHSKADRSKTRDILFVVPKDRVLVPCAGTHDIAT